MGQNRRWLYIGFRNPLSREHREEMMEWIDFADLAVEQEEMSDAPRRWLEPDAYTKWVDAGLPG